ncbi:hypothetical protein [Roseovarius sp.]|uniref:hypothetical protein n=1 Tax=Roseovarius sp. TaxID=1486281 RepID=UPI003A9751BC
MSPSDVPPTGQPTTALALASVNPQGKALGLRPGDTLLRVDAYAVDGQTKDLLALFKHQPDRPRVLWLRRGAEVWAVLSCTAILGRWRAVSVPDAAGALPAPLPAAQLRNFEVICNADNIYDAQSQKPSVLGLLPPIYMLQMRLWTPLAIWAALSVLCVPLGVIAGGALQALICIYFWRAAPMLVRADRMARGFRLWRVVAARSERDLHRQMVGLAPDLRFFFAAERAVLAGVEAR